MWRICLAGQKSYDTSVQELKSSDGQNSYPLCGACFPSLGLPLLGEEGLSKVTLGAFRNKGLLAVSLSKGWCLMVGGWVAVLSVLATIASYGNLYRGGKKIQWCGVRFLTEGTKALMMFCSYLKSTARSLSRNMHCSPNPSRLSHLTVSPCRTWRGLQPACTYTGGVDSGLRWTELAPLGMYILDFLRNFWP